MDWDDVDHNIHYDLDPLLYTPNIILERYCLIGMGLKTLNFLGWVLEMRPRELGFRVGSTKWTRLLGGKV